MKTKLLLFFSLSLIFAMFIGLSFSAQASPPLQTGLFETPTAGPDGRIIYTVEEGDTCSRLELLFQISNNELRSINPELDEDCTLILGQKIMLGMGGPAFAATFTPGPSPTPTEIPPTPTPASGTTEICVILFGDINGDGIRQENELGLAGGAISVAKASGGYSQTQNSTSEIDFETEEPAYICFGEKPPDTEEAPDSEKLPEGEYTVSAAIPDGYNPTSTLSYTLEVFAGERAFVGFGAQAQLIPEEVPAEEGGSSSALLGILGAILLLGGGGLGWYAIRMKKFSSEKLKY